jgi:hypothetical protein
MLSLHMNNIWPTMKWYVNNAEKVDLRIELVRFKEEMQNLSQDGKSSLESVGPYKWWLTQTRLPKMRRLALRLFSMRCSSASAERSFSAFKNIFSLKRTKLKEGRVHSLVFLYFNLRTLKKTQRKSSPIFYPATARFPC